MTTPHRKQDPPADPLEHCGCFNMRRLSRMITSLYDEALAPTGLRSTQTSILFAIDFEGEMPMSRLARRMELTLSTLSRNLNPLLREKYIECESTGNRNKIVKLTEKGKSLLRQAKPLWQREQDSFVHAIGGENTWERVVADLDHVLSIMQQKN